MSEYLVVESDVTSEKHLIAALMALGVPKECIEYHETPTNLRGFRGDTRAQKANVILRAKNVDKYLSGGASNDLGFELVNGKYQVRVSQYDRGKWWNKRQEEFLNEATAAKTIEQAKKRGYKIVREDKDGEIHLRVAKKY